VRNIDDTSSQCENQLIQSCKFALRFCDVFRGAVSRFGFEPKFLFIFDVRRISGLHVPVVGLVVSGLSVVGLLDSAASLLKSGLLNLASASGKTRLGRTNKPCIGRQRKYDMPFTVPSFLPSAVSSSMPIHTASASLENCVAPTNRIVPRRINSLTSVTRQR
jgi:hypothetical protein